MSVEYRVRDNVGFSTVVKEAKKLDQELRKLVAEAIENTIEEYGDEEDHYVRSKIEKKLKLTRMSSTSWVRDLSDGIWCLFEFYNSISNVNDCENSKYWKIAGATIFYFINPFDIIPDHTPDSGFSDDAFAFYYCIRQLPSDWNKK